MSSDAEQALIERYLQRLPSKISDIQGLIEVGDLLHVRSHLHKLSGSAGMYGLESVSLLAAQLEEMIVSGHSIESNDFQILFESLYAMVNKSV